MDKIRENIRVFGKEIIDHAAIDQLLNCTGEGDYGVLTADAHVGYGHPIGGAIAYRNQISLSGVGFDIACGNKAVRTNIKVSEIEIVKIMDEIEKNISFGIGRINHETIDHPVIDKIYDLPLKLSRTFKSRFYQKAREQLGTVGSGNHFVDLFRDHDDYLWIGVHFGSRGFGHGLTMGFIALSKGLSFEEPVMEGGMYSDPVLFDVMSEVGQDYLKCLEVAGEYAYAGRDWVVGRVLGIMSNPEVTYSVHNHHNFAWKERHFGDDYWVVRKGCTPAFPGQKGFIGSNMFDTSVIVEGVENHLAKEGLYSTVHGAGRKLSRRQAKGKMKLIKDPDGKKRWRVIEKGLVDYESTKSLARIRGVELRGGGADESPECYKNLDDVLAYQADSIRILYRLTPLGVIMAGEDVYDPYKD